MNKSVLSSAILFFFSIGLFGQGWVTVHNFGWTSKGVMLINNDVAWACNAIFSGVPLQAKVSTDGGYNWTGQNTGLPNGSAGNMRSVASPDSSNIFMIGNEGNLIFNGGDETWEIINLGSTLPLRVIQFASASVGYIGSDNGNFYKTVDGGITWENIGFVTGDSINAMYFLSESIGLVYTYGGGIYRTVDGGVTWEYLEFDQPLSVFSNGIRDMHFITDSLGFAVGVNNFVMRTQDGGSTWEFIPSGTDQTLQGVDFVNETYGFACGWNNTVIRTVDGGDSWQPMDTDIPTSTELLHDIDFFGNHGLMTTNSGFVLVFDLADMEGCTDPAACNYNAQATVDDGSCEIVEIFTITGSAAVEPGSEETYFYPPTPGSTYLWNVDNGAILSGQGSASVIVLWGDLAVGNVNVTETTQSGCVGEAVFKEILIGSTGIDGELSFPFVLFPNPTSDNIFLEFPESHEAYLRIRIFDGFGKLVISSDYSPIENNFGELSFQLPKSGVYWVNVLVGNRVYQQRCIRLN